MPVYQIDVRGTVYVTAVSEDEALRVADDAIGASDMVEPTVSREATLREEDAHACAWDGEVVSYERYQRERVREEIACSGRQPWVPPDDWSELLRVCCADSEMRPELSRPWSLDGGIGATNGKGLVWGDVTGPRHSEMDPAPELATTARAWLETRATLGSGWVPLEALRAWAIAADCQVCGKTWDERCPEPYGSREHQGLVGGGAFDRRLVALFVIAPASLAEDSDVRIDVLGTEEAPQIVARGEGWWASVMGTRTDQQRRVSLEMEHKSLEDWMRAGPDALRTQEESKDA